MNRLYPPSQYPYLSLPALPQEFFANIYASLLECYTFLANCRSRDELILKSGKKGNMKAHTVMRCWAGDLIVVQLTNALLHDYNPLRRCISPKWHLYHGHGIRRLSIVPKNYRRGLCYVTKIKRSLKYKERDSWTYVSWRIGYTHGQKDCLWVERRHESYEWSCEWATQTSPLSFFPITLCLA